MLTFTGRSRLGSALDLATVIMLAAVGFLFYDARQNPPATEQPREARPVPLSRGTLLRPVAVQYMSGKPLHLFQSRQSSPTLVFAFKTTCRACAVQKPDWLHIAQDAQRSGWQVVALTPENIDSTVARYFDAAGVQTYRLSDPQGALEVLGLHVVPTTLAVDEQGAVLMYAAGVMSSATRDSLQRVVVGRK